MNERVVVVSLVVKEDDRYDAKEEVVRRLNEWFNDLNTMMDGRQGAPALNGALLYYSILDETRPSILINGVRYVRTL